MPMVTSRRHPGVRPRRGPYMLVPSAGGELDWPAVSAAVPTVPSDIARSQEDAVVDLVAVPPVAQELADRFAAAGHRLYVVGGTVRDALLGRAGTDLDFTTDARPDAVLAVVEGWANAVWDTGIAFGTVGLRRQGVLMEITTFRSDAYDRVSRNPVVAYGDTIEDDLVRRDFTRQRDGGRAHRRAAHVRRPVRRPRRPGGRGAATRRPRRRSRSPTIRCGCCGPPGSSPSWGSRAAPRVLAAMTAMAAELGPDHRRSGCRSSCPS